MKADGVLNLLKFQRFQSVLMISRLKEPRSRLVLTNGEQKAKPE